VIFLLLLFGTVMAGRARARELPIGAFRPDALAEQSGCSIALRERPRTYAGRSRGSLSELEWLSRVAFRAAYGAWPNDADPQQVRRLAALVACVSQTTRGNGQVA
jgi:hypothetical protein